MRPTREIIILILAICFIASSGMTLKRLSKLTSYLAAVDNPSEKIDMPTLSDFLGARERVGFNRNVSEYFKQPIPDYDVAQGEEGVLELLKKLSVSKLSVDGLQYQDRPRIEMASKESSLSFFKEPVLNSIQLLSNKSFDIWILRQKTFAESDFRTYALVHEKRKFPNEAYYIQIKDDGYYWRGGTCYECHVNGPRLIRPLRDDLVSDDSIMRSINQYILSLPVIETHFPENEPRNASSRLRLEKCDRCHNDVDRAAIYQVHAATTEMLVAAHEMPLGVELDFQEQEYLRNWEHPIDFLTAARRFLYVAVALLGCIALFKRIKPAG